ncbi:hypothetical protein CQW23_08747 [Capsicum baccatum]|uniref:Uncharacterized protein n=1 Tax=Capsicum baccatum TaxID=33114 RepID=A0A2G2X9W9_CAPBA|nr:hypothetical protein CQW23_08747 [Capsicum baccatum]
MPSSKGNRGRNNRRSKWSNTNRKATRRSVDPSSNNTSVIFSARSNPTSTTSGTPSSCGRLSTYPACDLEIVILNLRFNPGKEIVEMLSRRALEGFIIMLIHLGLRFPADMTGLNPARNIFAYIYQTFLLKFLIPRKMRLPTGIILMTLFMASHVNSFVGITWGRQQSQLLVPSMVIDMLLQNKIPAVRFMSSASDIIQIFAATNISISIRITNRTVNRLNKKTLVYEWLEAKIKEPINKGVKIVELTVGTEPFSNALYVPKYDVVDSISMMRDVLDEMDLGHVTTTIGHGVDVFNISKAPPNQACAMT